MPRPAYAVICMFACWPAGAQAEPTPRETRLIAQVERDLAKGRAARATRKLGDALASGGATSAELWLRYAELRVPCSGESLLALNARELREAAHVWGAFPEQLARDRREQDEAFRRALLHRAVFLARAGSGSGALDLARLAARREDPESVACLRQLAAQAVAHEDLPAAEGALRLARGLLPQHHALPRELGLVLLARGNARGAVAQLEEAFSIDPRQLEVRRDLAYALASAGRASEGYALLAVESERCAEHTRCSLELARLALEGASLEAAEQHASALVRRDPKNLESWLLLGEVRTRAGHMDEAKRAYEEALRLSPGNPRAREALRSLSQ